MCRPSGRVKTPAFILDLLQSHEVLLINCSDSDSVSLCIGTRRENITPIRQFDYMYSILIYHYMHIQLTL